MKRLKFQKNCMTELQINKFKIGQSKVSNSFISVRKLMKENLIPRQETAIPNFLTSGLPALMEPAKVLNEPNPIKKEIVPITNKDLRAKKVTRIVIIGFALTLAVGIAVYILIDKNNQNTHTK